MVTRELRRWRREGGKGDTFRGKKRVQRIVRKRRKRKRKGGKKRWRR